MKPDAQDVGTLLETFHMTLSLTAVRIALAALLTAALSDAAIAQNYPTRPIQLIAPAAPAGNVDTLTRIVAQKLSESLGVPVVVENRVGANGMIGADAVAKAPKDGYTIGMGYSSLMAINPFLYKMPYDTLRDFEPVALVARGPVMLAVHPSLPVHSVSELIALAKSKPGQLNYASTGVGSIQHLSFELFKSIAGVNIMHVPFKGSSQANVALLSGDVQVMNDNLVTLLPLAKAGRVRLLAVSTSARSTAIPELPTFAEAGVPGYEASTWYGVIAPAGTDPKIVAKLSKEIERIVGLQDVRDKFSSMGMESFRSSTPADFTAVIRADTARWGKVIKEAGVRAE
jgi:tripartite-type tricarboxylate transporter receptor subunit TctC